MRLFIDFRGQVAEQTSSPKLGSATHLDTLTKIALQTVDRGPICRRAWQQILLAARRGLRDILVDGSNDDLVLRREVIKHRPLRRSGRLSNPCYGGRALPAVPTVANAPIHQ